MPVETHNLGEDVDAFVTRSRDELVGVLTSYVSQPEEAAQAAIDKGGLEVNESMIVVFVHSDNDRQFARELLPFDPRSSDPKYEDRKIPAGIVMWGMVNTSDPVCDGKVSIVSVPFSSERVKFLRVDAVAQYIYDAGHEMPERKFVGRQSLATPKIQ